MTHEGVTLIAKAVLVALLIISTAIARVFVGPSKRRGRSMAIGAFGGMASGVFAAYVLSRWIKTDISALSACVGIVVGWMVTWPFARTIPRHPD